MSLSLTELIPRPSIAATANHMSDQIQSIKQSVDLRELAGRYTELRRASGDKELRGPCPRAGCTAQTDGFHCQAGWFMCYTCHPKRGDAIEFIMWKDGVGFKEAVGALNNASMPASPTKRAPTPDRCAKPVYDWRSAAWQRKNAPFVEHGHERLMEDSDQEAQPGRDHLDRRGIEPQTRQAFKLGFAMHWHSELQCYEPAIVMPWYTTVGTLRGVRLRFLHQYKIGEKNGKPVMSQKIVSVNGAGQFSGALFGAQLLGQNIPKLSTLSLLEGEFNAMSAWQESRNTHLDVLSLGSESANISAAMAAYILRYKIVLPWLDRAERVQSILAALGLPEGIESPNGMDANDLLQAGKLGGFLAKHRSDAAKKTDAKLNNTQEQQRLLWDLWDASQLPLGIDENTTKVMHAIARKLGVST